jgi:hypothetical protein
MNILQEKLKEIIIMIKLIFYYYVYFGVSTQTNLLDNFFDGIMGLGRKYSNTKYSVL